MIEDYGAIEAESRVDLPSCDPLETGRSWGRSLEESVSFPCGASIKTEEEEEIYHLPLTEFDPLLTIELPKGKGIRQGYEELEEIKPERVEEKVLGTLEKPLKELLGGAPYGKSKELTKPSGKLDVEEFRIRQNILNLTSKFEQSGELELLDLIESKKYAREKEKKEWLAEIVEVEEKYYEDIPPIPEGLMKPLREQPPMPMKKARKTLGEFKELVNERNLDEKVIKSLVKMLEISITQ
jgi:hypothetical protein